MSLPGITHIKDTCCPHCKAAVSAVRVDHLHTCGDWNEHVTYKCGLELHWSPNYGSQSTVKLCQTKQEKELAIKLPLTVRLLVPKELEKKDIKIEIPDWGWNFKFSYAQYPHKTEPPIRLKKVECGRGAFTLENFDSTDA